MKGLLGKIAALVARGTGPALARGYEAPASLMLPMPDFSRYTGTPMRRWRRKVGKLKQRLAYPRRLWELHPQTGLSHDTIRGYDHAMSIWLNSGRVGERPQR